MLDPIRPSQWHTEALWMRLAPLLPGITVEVHARVESTNTRLLDRARETTGLRDAPVTRPGHIDPLPADARTPLGRRADDIAPMLLVAEHQTRGRGRHGRGWFSSPGASLTFSLALPLAPREWHGLSLAVGLALADAIDPANATAAGHGVAAAPLGAHRSRIGLKWPNDLWLLDAPGRGRKLGGVLIETIHVGDRRMCVVGVGLNVLPQPGDGAPDLTHGYACLQEIDPRASAPGALHAVAEPLVRALLRFERDGFAPLVAGYARRDLLRGRPVETTPPEAMQGVADGVDAAGALRVVSGGVHRIVSGEVSVRLAPARGG